MNKEFELISTEKSYYNELTDDEKKAYVATNNQLAKMRAHNDYYVNAFVDVSMILNEVHRKHYKYNEINEHNQKLADEFENELFNLTIGIGLQSAVFMLGFMDECDALYDYLAKIKMLRFDMLIDNFCIEELI